MVRVLSTSSVETERREQTVAITGVWQCGSSKSCLANNERKEGRGGAGKLTSAPRYHNDHRAGHHSSVPVIPWPQLSEDLIIRDLSPV